MTKQACVAIFERYRLAFRVLALAFALLICNFFPYSRAEAACTVPNQISNGQPADATAVMGNFNALKECADEAVTPSGAPATGNLSVFSSPNTITGGNLSGDCTTSGSLSVTCTKSNGVTLGHFATGTDASQLTGTISVNRFDNGNGADSSRFLRGDGVWAVPPSGGGGGGGPAGTPTIRASDIRSFNTSSVTIPWPAGPAAGDVVIIFVSSGYAVNSPAGWLLLNNTGSNDWANGLTAVKIMSSADITAGSVVVTLIGAYDGVAASVTVDGASMNGVRGVSAARSAGSTSYSSAPVLGLYDAVNTDLLIGFTYTRGAMNPSISNFTQLQVLNSANASGFLGRYGSLLGKLGLSETSTYPSSNNGYYWSVVALR